MDHSLSLVMFLMDITQYRITIGVWFLVSPLKPQYILILIIKGLIYMLLMKSGDVHPNPGPIENQSNVPQLKYVTLMPGV